MEIPMIFHILEIPETRDQRTIQKAYREKLKRTNPEDDQEGFKKLRMAYEKAMEFAGRNQLEERQKLEKTPVEFWLDQVNEIYRDMDRRRDEKQWRALLSAPLCEELDTFVESRDALLLYLMNHSNLPHTIWQMIDDRFQIREDRKNLEEQFPPHFLEYMIACMEQEEFLKYALFEIRDREQVDGDAYIRHYFEIEEQMDEEEYEDCERRLEELKAFGLYHPYEDVLRIRLMMVFGQTEEGILLGRKLLLGYSKDTYICLMAAEAFWNGGEWEEAKRIWKGIYEANPANYSAVDGLIRWYLHQGEYQSAKKLIFKLKEQYGWSDTLSRYIKSANDSLIEKCEALLSDFREGKEDEGFITSLEELKASLKPHTDLTESSEIEFEIFWLMKEMGQTEEAIVYLKKAIEENPDQGQYHMAMGDVLADESRYEEAIEEYEQAGEPFCSQPSYHYTLGICYEKVGLEWTAVREYKKCLDYEETYQDACRRLYSIYWNDYQFQWRRDDYHLAMKYISCAIDKEETRYDLITRGRLYAEGYEFDLAMADFEKALTCGEFPAYTYFCMGNCFWAMGQLDKAMELFEQSLSVMNEEDSIPELFQNAADCCRALGQYEAAIVWCQRGLWWFSDRDNGEIFIKMSGCYQLLGEYEKALKHLEQAREHPDYYARCADVYYCMGKTEEGIGLLIQALCDAKTSEQQADILSVLADFYTKYNLGLKRAVGFLESIFSGEIGIKEQWDYRLQTAKLFFRCQDLEKAQYYGHIVFETFQYTNRGKTEIKIEHYLSYQPYHSRRLCELGWMYICLGEIEKGLTFLEEMERCRCRECEYKGCCESFRNRGFYYEAIGEYEKALECYEKVLELNPEDMECTLRAANMKDAGLCT